MRMARVTFFPSNPLPAQPMLISGLALWALLLLGLATPRAHSQASAPTARQPARPATQTARRPGGGGMHEGLKVHGHWVIEVRNPDGSLVRHVEFENSLAGAYYIPPGFPTGSGPLTNGANLPPGATYMNALLVGEAAAPAGNLEIALMGPNVTGFASAGAPCVSLPQSLGACFLLMAGASCTASAGVSCNLTTGNQTATYAPGPIQFSGSVVTTQTGSINGVATYIANPCANISHCFLGSQYQQPIDTFTEVDSDTSNFPVVQVNANQSISVLVTISFQ